MVRKRRKHGRPWSAKNARRISVCACEEDRSRGHETRGRAFASIVPLPARPRAFMSRFTPSSGCWRLLAPPERRAKNRRSGSGSQLSGEAGSWGRAATTSAARVAIAVYGFLIDVKGQGHKPCLAALNSATRVRGPN